MDIKERERYRERYRKSDLIIRWLLAEKHRSDLLKDSLILKPGTRTYTTRFRIALADLLLNNTVDLFVLYQ